MALWIGNGAVLKRVCVSFLFIHNKQTVRFVVEYYDQEGLGALYIYVYMLQPICEISHFMKWLKILAIS